MESAFPGLPMIAWVEWASYPALEQALADRQFRVFTLAGAGISSKETFFAHAALDLPEDPPDVRSNWDALSDSLYGGIAWLEERRVAVALSHGILSFRYAESQGS